MQCQLCLRERKLIKAHVLPEGFFRLLRTEERAPEIHTNTMGEYAKRAPIGVYGRTILYAECEGLFGKWDAYAQELLLREFEPGDYLEKRGQREALKIPTFDYAQLKLFFISLLWRASVSTHSFYARVRTGPFEPVLRHLILAADAARPEDFAVSIAKLEHPLGHTILGPHPERWSGINYMRFYLGGYVAYIKVDKRPTPRVPGSFKLLSGNPLIIVLRNLERSKELPLIGRIVVSSEITKRANEGTEGSV